MSEGRRGERLFEAWRNVQVESDHTEAGRARFLEAIAARRTRRTSAYVVLAAAAAILLCVTGLAWWSRSRTLTFTTAEGEGQSGAWLATGPATDLPITFSEGSHVVLAADSRGRVEDLERTGAVFVLERGAVRAQVQHRSSTSWRFRAGPFDVQVTGTKLAVEWDPQRERFAVRVDEGSVVVHGPSIGTDQVVRTGERCDVDLPSRSVRVSPVDARPAPTASVQPTAEDDAAAPVAPGNSTSMRPQGIAPVPTSAWTTFEEKGDYQGSYASARRGGFVSVLRTSSADELMRLAQVCQVTGHSDDQREALLACRRRFPGSQQAALSAYELGRMSPPAEAGGWFEAYLSEQPSGPLAREALGRLLEVRASAGDAAGARETAMKYLARYPDGPEAALAYRIVSGAR
jgi:hypothetical protein